MKGNNQIEILQENINGLKEAQKWLQRSYDICRNHPFPPRKDEEMDDFESLTSRYARAGDILFNKVFRSIYYIENAETASLLDVTLFMERVGVVDDALEARKIKELRNDIVHDYSFDDLNVLFGEVLTLTPVLIDSIKKAIDYSEKLKKKFYQ